MFHFQVRVYWEDTDAGGIVLVQPGIDMRRTRGHGDAVGHRHPRHGERRRKIRWPVVDAGKQVAVQIVHVRNQV